MRMILGVAGVRVTQGLLDEKQRRATTKKLRQKKSQAGDE